MISGNSTYITLSINAIVREILTHSPQDIFNSCVSKQWYLMLNKLVFWKQMLIRDCGYRLDTIPTELGARAAKKTYFYLHHLKKCNPEAEQYYRENIIDTGLYYAPLHASKPPTYTDNDSYRICFREAIYFGNLELAEKLLKYEPDFSILLEAIERGNLRSVKWLMNDNNYKFVSQYTYDAKPFLQDNTSLVLQFNCCNSFSAEDYIVESALRSQDTKLLRWITDKLKVNISEKHISRRWDPESCRKIFRQNTDIEFFQLVIPNFVNSSFHRLKSIFEKRKYKNPEYIQYIKEIIYLKMYFCSLLSGNIKIIEWVNNHVCQFFNDKIILKTINIKKLNDYTSIYPYHDFFQNLIIREKDLIDAAIQSGNIALVKDVIATNQSENINLKDVDASYIIDSKNLNLAQWLYDQNKSSYTSFYDLLDKIISHHYLSPLSISLLNYFNGTNQYKFYQIKDMVIYYVKSNLPVIEWILDAAKGNLSLTKVDKSDLLHSILDTNDTNVTQALKYITDPARGPNQINLEELFNQNCSYNGFNLHRDEERERYKNFPVIISYLVNNLNHPIELSRSNYSFFNSIHDQASGNTGSPFIANIRRKLGMY